ncbi:MAG: DUF948 domain-containing protein [Candidatus Eisenbacteria bacterium]|nr:DUF948 domain-containing protein [Candidatus Eisenbacteria bacterium]
MPSPRRPSRQTLSPDPHDGGLMNVTFTISEFFLLIMAVALAVGSWAVVRVARRVSRTTEEIERTMQRLEPRIEQLTREATQEIGEIRTLTRHLNGVAEDAESISHGITKSAMPLLEDVERLRLSRRYFAAAAAGVKTGLDAWRRRSGKD